MNTENESWREDSNEENASRDGNRVYNRDGYNRRDDNRSYNRDSNYNSNYNRDGRQSQSRSYGDRPRTSYNKYGSNDRSSGYNRNSGDRPQRSYNRDDNNSGYNREGGERQYRPRFNREEGSDNRSSYNRSSGDRPQRSYNSNNYNRGNSDYNRVGSSDYNRSSNTEGGERPRRRITSNSYGTGSSYGNSGSSSYGNRNTSDRPRRPRFTPNDGGNTGGGYNRGGGYNNGGGYRQQGGYSQSNGYSRTPRRSNDYDPNAKYSQKKRIEYKEQFTDPNEPIRLNKFLANAGVCSRREADEFITTGVVSVNDVVVTELGTKIKRTDLVKFHDEPVNIEGKVYILLNKPKNCVTTSDDPQERSTVMDFVKNACTERIYPVGRLDRNTTGVLLLTNDGDLASKLTHPKFLKKKIYQVTTDKDITRTDMSQIIDGIKLDEETEIKADGISYVDDYKRNQVGIEIHSGQNRIVRRIFESLGYRVIKLDRVYFAGLTKKGLKRGDWRYLTENEVNYLRMGSFT